MKYSIINTWEKRQRREKNLTSIQKGFSFNFNGEYILRKWNERSFRVWDEVQLNWVEMNWKDASYSLIHQARDDWVELLLRLSL